jgi:hypothetical protein
MLFGCCDHSTAPTISVATRPRISRSIDMNSRLRAPNKHWARKQKLGFDSLWDVGWRYPTTYIQQSLRKVSTGA